METSRRVLVTGATGYVGGRLVTKLLEHRYAVTVVVRDPERVRSKPWASKVTCVVGDFMDADVRWARDLERFDAAFFLIHSIQSGGAIESAEETIVENFTRAFPDLKHVIYLGGHMPRTGAVSSHLRSRARTGELLAKAFPLTEFRAGPVIGSGSASFEMLRYLCERLPLMVTPKWVGNTVVPIAVRDVLSYLLEALNKGPAGIVEIGSDTLTFKEMMLRYAKIRGLKRKILVLPMLTPGLAGRWVGLVTPISNNLAVPIIKSMVAPIEADLTKAKALYPDVKPIPFDRAVALALNKVREHMVETRWTDATNASSPETLAHTDQQGMIHEVRSLHVKCSTEACYATFTGLGGDRGWLVWGWAWRLRGAIDKVFGGPGLRRGRRHPDRVNVGDVLDFWRVEHLDIGRELLLRAEMKVPGKAWLHFTAEPEQDGSRLVQTAHFLPSGLAGVAYWYLLYPLHRYIFSDMINAIGTAAERREHKDGPIARGTLPKHRLKAGGR